MERWLKAAEARDEERAAAHLYRALHASRTGDLDASIRALENHCLLRKDTGFAEAEIEEVLTRPMWYEALGHPVEPALLERARRLNPSLEHPVWKGYEDAVRSRLWNDAARIAAGVRERHPRSLTTYWVWLWYQELPGPKPAQAAELEALMTALREQGQPLTILREFRKLDQALRRNRD